MIVDTREQYHWTLSADGHPPARMFGTVAQAINAAVNRVLPSAGPGMVKVIREGRRRRDGFRVSFDATSGVYIEEIEGN